MDQKRKEWRRKSVYKDSVKHPSIPAQNPQELHIYTNSVSTDPPLVVDMPDLSTTLSFMYNLAFVNPPPVKIEGDLSGQVGIVTGSNVGLGFEASRSLVKLGLSHLIMAVRNEAAGAKAREELLKTAPNTKIEVWKLDMSSYSSITAFVDRVKTIPRIDFAILNAGIYAQQYEKCPETGHESTYQVNWISTALLTILLLPVIKNGKGTNKRITIVCSDMHEMSTLKWETAPSVLEWLDDPKNFSTDAEFNYSISKTLEVLFVRELVKHISDAVTVNLANPGFTKGTNFHNETSGSKALMLKAMKVTVGRTLEVGARDLVRAAVGLDDGRKTHGLYISDGILQK